MPTPLELVLHPVNLTILALYGALALAEFLKPARKLPGQPWWRVRGMLAFALFFFASSYLPLIWDGWLARFQVLDLTGLPFALQCAIGFLVYELAVYTWHRCLHESDFLWRYFHQFHHSAERLDTFGAFWFSPLDMFGWIVLGSLALVLFVGVGPQAATAIILLTTFLSIFTHANIRTPRWLGYLIQRPESHGVHHARGFHRRNYCDLPVIDAIFGTLENPVEHREQFGLVDGGSMRIGTMLLGRDITRAGPVEEKASAGIS